MSAPPNEPRPDRVDALVEEARDRSGPERAEYLSGACGGDEALRRAVEARLAEEDADLTVTLGGEGPSPGGGAAWEALIAELAEARPGTPRYEDHGEFARGGMGQLRLVFDRTVRRRLAMKVLLDPDGGAPSDAARSLAYFLEEAQITGQLDHPGIVPVHELGVDERGRVFFTMKLVRGDDLRAIFDRVADPDDADWTTTRALNVLLRVCDAMAYAHAKRVVHRDLKPANVMVGRYGEVYVMDWGLARVLGQPGAQAERLGVDETVIVKVDREATVLQAAGASPDSLDGDVVGTPAYMPPEQAEGRKDLLGPTADVYAVGAMLYHLLAGRMPYAKRGERPTGATVLARLFAGPPMPLELAARDAPAELVAICEKAMAREIERRYPDMTSLGRDLRAFLENKVVAAYEGGPWAEMKKWAQRNRALSATALAALLVATLSGFGLAWLEGRNKEAIAIERNLARANEREAETQRARADRSAEEARRRAAEAERARRQAQAVNTFLDEDVLGAVRPEDRGIDVTMREVLDGASARLAGRFDDAPVVEASIRTGIGRTYVSLGRFDEAEGHLARAVALTEEAAATPEHRRARALLGGLYTQMGRYREADPLLEAGLEAARVGAEDPRETWSALTALGRLRAAQGRYRDAEDLLAEARAGRLRTLGADDPETIASDQDLATLFRNWGRYDDAEPLQRRVLEACARIRDAEHPETLSARHERISLLLDVGRFEDGVAQARELLDVRRRVLGEEHPRTLDTMNLLGHALFALRRDVEAESVWRETLEVRRRVLGAAHPNTVSSVGNLASVLDARGEFEEAGALYRSAVETSAAARGAEHPETLVAQQNLGEFERSRGRAAEAEARFVAVIEASTRIVGAESPLLLAPMRNLANLRADQRRHEEALEILTDALDLARRTLGDEHPRTAGILSDLGLACVYAGRRDEARRHLERALTLQQDRSGTGHVDTATTRQNLAVLEVAEKRFDRAFALQREVVDLRARAFGDDHPLTLSARTNLADVSLRLGKAQEAALLYKEVLDASRRTLGDDHPATLRAFHELADLMRRGRRYDDAIVLATQEYENAAGRYGRESALAQRAVELLIRIHEKLEQPERVAEWRARKGKSGS